MGDCRGLCPADLCLRGKPTSYQIASVSQSQKMQKVFCHRFVFDASPHRSAGGESRHRKLQKIQNSMIVKEKKTKSQISKSNNSPDPTTDCDDEDVDAAKFFQAWELAIMRDQ
jgi:hypothetical protein